jgi:antitoxin component YwqK of YwqJK toxin-antitoxin module
MKSSLVLIFMFFIALLSCKHARTSEIDDSGKRSGFVEQYDDNGRIISKKHYVNGIQDGEYFYYHPNGKISLKGRKVSGELDGPIISYNELGNPIYGIVYSKGNKLKKIFYYSNGKKRKMIDYVDSVYVSYDSLENVIRSKKLKK